MSVFASPPTLHVFRVDSEGLGLAVDLAKAVAVHPELVCVNLESLTLTFRVERNVVCAKTHARSSLDSDLAT